MNVFGKSERSWRKARKRAVSPIIATILLVAITVVLAAVLYVLISGLTHGPGSTPIGSAFTAGNPTPSTTTSGAAAACTTIGAASTIATFVPTAHYLYTLTVETSTITMTSFLFEVKTATGAVDGAAAGFYVVNVGGVVVACSNGLTGAMTTTMGSFSSGATACNGATCTSSTPLTSIYTIVIDMGTTNPAGTGLTFVAIGTGSYSGTTSPLGLP
jgi:flagellin-like protein